MEFDFTINVSLIITIVGFACAGVWGWAQLHGRARANTRLAEEARTSASAAEAAARLLQNHLQEYKTHVSEQYISKQGFREAMAGLSTTLQSIDGNMRHMSERIDRLFDKPPREDR